MLHRAVSFWGLCDACVRHHGGNHAGEAKTYEGDDRALGLYMVPYSSLLKPSSLVTNKGHHLRLHCVFRQLMRRSFTAGLI